MQVFQVVPPVVRDIGNGLEIDQDFLSSLSIYMDTFESFTVACPVRVEDAEIWGLGQCVPLRDLPWGPERFKYIPLPATYRPGDFLKVLPKVRKILRAEIEASEHLIFTPYSLIGDWPTVAIREAVKLGRRYTIEADGVHGDIMRKRHISSVAWKRWVKRMIEFPAFDRSYRYNLQNASLAIFQGQDVYNAYARYCSKPVKLNHHIPVYSGDHIALDQLEAKLASVRAGNPLKIVYAGRAIDMKGPLEWVATLKELNKRGVKFEAAWLGDGPMLDAMKAQNVPDILFLGFVGDRNRVLAALREAHIFLFCHNTLESARILGEALACGAPLVGFLSDYPADLVSDYGGALFSEMGDVIGLADILSELDKNRAVLTDLIANAAASGREFDRHALLKRRVEMVKATPVRENYGPHRGPSQ